MKKYIKLIGVAAFLMVEVAHATKPSPEFMDQVKILSVIDANLTYCLLGNEDKKISSEDYLKFNDVSMKASSIIDKIEKKFNDHVLYTAFKMQTYDIMNSKEFMQEFAKKYSRRCSLQMLEDMRMGVGYVESNVNSLLRK